MKNQSWLKKGYSTYSKKGLNPPSSNKIIIDIRGVEGTEKL